MRRFFFALMALFSVVVAAVSIRYFLAPQSAPLLQTKSGIFRTLLLIHAGASLVALAVGPFQFSTRLRRRSPRMHRLAGYLYFVGVFVGGGVGLVSATGAEGGLTARTGFFLLGVCWLTTAWIALSAARRGDFAAHGRWMVRNFALTFAAVTLRLWLPALAAATGNFLEAYQTVAWLCWVPNAIVAEILLGRKGSASGAVRRASESETPTEQGA
jgi:uncharacterized membrane protein